MQAGSHMRTRHSQEKSSETINRLKT